MVSRVYKCKGDNRLELFISAPFLRKCLIFEYLRTKDALNNWSARCGWIIQGTSSLLVNWAKHKNTFPALTVNVRELTPAQSSSFLPLCRQICICWAPICCINEITSEQSHKISSWHFHFSDKFNGRLQGSVCSALRFKVLKRIFVLNAGISAVTITSELIQFGPSTQGRWYKKKKKNLGDLCKILMWTKAVQTPRISFRTDFY